MTRPTEKNGSPRAVCGGSGPGDSEIVAEAIRGMNIYAEFLKSASWMDSYRSRTGRVVSSRRRPVAVTSSPEENAAGTLQMHRSVDALPLVESATCGWDLEEQLVADRVRLTEPHRQMWRQYWAGAGRPTRIMDANTGTPATASASSTRGKPTEVFLDLNNPHGRRTRYEARMQQPSLARTVPQTLARVRVAELHRSTHYPAPPSTERLHRLGLVRRPDGVTVEAASSGPLPAFTPRTCRKGEALSGWFRKLGIDEPVGTTAA